MPTPEIKALQDEAAVLRRKSKSMGRLATLVAIAAIVLAASFMILMAVVVADSHSSALCPAPDDVVACSMIPWHS